MASLELAKTLALTASGAYLAYKLFQFCVADADLQTYNVRLPPHTFKDKVVWITGASSGIGRALAEAFAAQGSYLILSSRSERALEDVKASLPVDDLTRVAVLPVDLEDLPSLTRTALLAQDTFGRVDILVNCAGMSTRCLARETSLSVYDRVMRLDFFSLVYLTKALLPQMIVNRSGHIVNINSACGKFGAPLRAGYCAAKHAVLGYFDALRLEEESTHGIHVTNVCPGFVRTNASINALKGDGSPMGKMDVLLDQGMSPARCAHLTLAAVHGRVHEAWVSNKLELLAMYVSQYIPSLLYPLLKSQMNKLVKSGLTEAPGTKRA